MAGLITLSILIWFALQFRPARSRAWSARAAYITPLVLHIGKDIAATSTMVRDHFKRRQSTTITADRILDGIDLDSKLKRFFG